MEQGARAVADRMAEAVTDWIESLDTQQRAGGLAATPAAHGPSDADRRRWFYTPVDHGGLTLHQQRPAQQQAVMRLVASGLSDTGFTTVATVLGLENVLDRDEDFPPTGSHGRERRRDPGLYYLRVFGEPGGAGPWGWRFGGHHVSLNNLVVDGAVVATTPCFLGANPAASPLLGGSMLRPLACAEDLARELVRSLCPELAARAVLPRAPSDIVTGNRSRIDELTVSADEAAVSLTPAPKGIPATELDAGQREMLRALLDTYLGRVPDEVAPAYSAGDLDAVHVAWAGSTAPGEPHYYRLQGPRLLAEWDNTQRDGNHAHSVWRDPESDFGLDVLAGHRATHHS